MSTTWNRNACPWLWGNSGDPPLYTYLAFPPWAMRFYHEKSPHSQVPGLCTHWIFFHLKSLPELSHRGTNWTLHCGAVYILLHLSVLSTASSHRLPSTLWSSISLWPWAVILLEPWTLSRTFISIHLFNGIVNDLKGVNHSQDNGCKKLIDMIFMI